MSTILGLLVAMLVVATAIAIAYFLTRGNGEPDGSSGGMDGGGMDGGGMDGGGMDGGGL